MSDFVWVVERGCYSDRYIQGVYRTLAGAKASVPKTDPPGDGAVQWNSDRSWWSRTDPDGWTESARVDGSYANWSNGLDWDDAADIRKVELGP